MFSNILLHILTSQNIISILSDNSAWAVVLFVYCNILCYGTDMCMQYIITWYALGRLILTYYDSVVQTIICIDIFNTQVNNALQ